MAGSNFTIDVDTQELRNTAGDIRTINDKLCQDLEDIFRTMNQTQNDWQSEAGNEIRDKMTNLKNNFFESYKNVVDSYQRFLDNTAQQYETTETNIHNNARAFQ